MWAIVPSSDFVSLLWVAVHLCNALDLWPTPAIMGQNVNVAKPSLLDRTRELLNNRPRGVTLRSIAEATDLSTAFIHRVSTGVMDDPGVVKIQRLYEYLSGRSLDVA